MGSTPSKPVFQLDKYMGLWHELARYPITYEAGCRDPTVEYIRIGDQIKAINRCVQPDNRISEAIGWGNYAGGSIIRLDFQRDFESADYTVLATDYTNYAFVAGNRGRFWILGRNSDLTPQIKAGLIQRTRELGYDPDHLIWDRL